MPASMRLLLAAASLALLIIWPLAALAQGPSFPDDAAAAKRVNPAGIHRPKYEDATELDIEILVRTQFKLQMACRPHQMLHKRMACVPGSARALAIMT